MGWSTSQPPAPQRRNKTYFADCMRARRTHLHPVVLGTIPAYTVMDHSTNHPKFSHETLIHTLRYLTGSYCITRYLVYYKGFVISYKMQPWRQIRVSLEEVTVPTQRTTHKRECCHIRHIIVTGLKAGSSLLLPTLKHLPPESDNVAKPCILHLAGPVLFLEHRELSLVSRVIFWCCL